jgi:hypothetical protein
MLSQGDIDTIVAATISISEKIRRLDAGEVKRADIARLLGKRYQHVRNVLEGEKLRSAARPEPSPDPSAAPSPHGVEEAGSQFRGVFRLVVSADGGLQLPAEVLAHEGWEPGRVVMATFEDDKLTVITAKASIRKAQDLARSIFGENTNMVEELIADRRRAALAEMSDD